jgi:hypothetical protein
MAGYSVYRGGFTDRKSRNRLITSTNDNPGPDTPMIFCAEFDTVPQSVQLFSGHYIDPYWPNSILPSFAPPVFTNNSSMSGGQTYYSYVSRIGGLFSLPSNTTVLKSR